MIHPRIRLQRIPPNPKHSIYRYYKNKDALFEALVADPAKALFDRYNKYSKTFSNHSLDRQLSILFNEEDTEIKELVNHLYKHYDAFKLIACCAKGTSYEDYVEKLIEIETKSSLNLVNLMQKEKNICHDIDEQMIHIIMIRMIRGGMKAQKEKSLSNQNRQP